MELDSMEFYWTCYNNLIKKQDSQQISYTIQYSLYKADNDMDHKQL